MTQPQPFAPVVEVTRAYEVESAHRGAIAVVDSGGRLVASLGQASQAAYVRSCAKPFQALALVCSGAADAYGLGEEELAIVCSSHSGEPEQVALVESLMSKTGVRPEDLQCGIHPPFDAGARAELRQQGAEPSVLQNNCSGKHAGMIATARFLDLPTEDYTDPEHGVQLAILGLLATLAGLDPEEIGIGQDGCAAPAFYLPLRSFSLAMARLAAQGEGSEDWLRRRPVPDDLDIDELQDDTEEETLEIADGFPVSIQEGLTRVWQAMIRHPELVAGTRGRLCTDLMKVAHQFGVPLVAKSGAEGTYTVGVFEDGVGLGLTFKIEDGAQRARDAAVLETLFQLGLLPDGARGPLAGYHRQIIQTLTGEPVGELRPNFRLHRGLPA